MIVLVKHATSVRCLDGVMVSFHLKHLVATGMWLPVHVVHHVGVATAHAVGCKASWVIQAMVLLVMNLLQGRDLRERILSGDGSGGWGLGSGLALAFSDSASLSTSFDSLVAVLVVGGKVFEQLTVCLGYLLA